MVEAASTPLQYRALTEAAPPSARDPERVAQLHADLLAYKPALAMVRRQKETGLWGGGIFAPGANRAVGWAETGTVFQYMRLRETGWPADDRAFRVSDRLLYRLLSRDDDPTLLFEFQRPAKTDPGLGLWARGVSRMAAAAALARAGRVDDPRLRGTAHNVMSDVSLYLRSGLVDKPFRKASGKTVLDPLATPPNIFMMIMLAFLPALQRERAGFLERLAAFFSSPAPRRAFYIQAGKRFVPPLFEILGDPLRSDAQGRVTDVPFAVFWLELLARLGIVRQVPSASRVLARLFAECDDQGIWSPRNLRTPPKSAQPILGYYYPLEGPGKSPAQRQTDVTFRLALIAQIMGIPVEVV